MLAKHRSFSKPILVLSGLAVSLGMMPGCASVAGSASIAQVRIIDASPDAPGLDILEGSGVLAYNLGFGTITSYVPLVPGVYSISANGSGTKQQLVSARGTFSPSQQYTVIIGNVTAALGENILLDQSQPAPAGQIALRFIDQATKVGGVDLYLVPSGSQVTDVSPALTNVVFGTNTGYVNVPMGTYTLVAMPTGVKPTLPVTTTSSTDSTTTAAYYTGSSVAYAGGSASTIVLIDQQIVTASSLQVISALDYAPAGTT